MTSLKLRSLALAGVLLAACGAARAQSYQVTFNVTTELQNVFVYGDEWNGSVYAWDLFPAALGTVHPGISTFSLGSHNLQAWSIIANHGPAATAMGINSSIDPPTGLPFETVFPGFPMSTVASNIAALNPSGAYNVQPAYYLFNFALTNEDTLKTDHPTGVLHIYTFSNGADVGTATIALAPACTAPSLSQGPAPTSACMGADASFTTTYGGTTPLTYTWRKNGVVVSNGYTIDGSLIQGATTGTITVVGVTPGDQGSYSCSVSNSCGSLPPTAASTATLAIGAPASVTADPVNVAACGGAAASFTVQAGGVGPFYYQWQKNGIPLTGETRIVGVDAPTLTFTSTIAADAGFYDCMIWNDCGGPTSAAAQLFINSADFNGDGDVGTDADIEAFFACLAGNCCPICGSADFNGDGDIGTDADIESFFRVLSGGSC